MQPGEEGRPDIARIRIGDNTLDWDALQCPEDPEALVAASLKLAQELPLLQPGVAFDHVQVGVMAQLCRPPA